ncbi:hypothetical protein LINPERPRIM_LOCUS40468 [Linum perenne]
MNMSSTQTTTSALPPFVPSTIISTLTDPLSLPSLSTPLTSVNMVFTLIVSLPILVGAPLLFLDPLPAILMQCTSFTPIFV